MIDKNFWNLVINSWTSVRIHISIPEPDKTAKTNGNTSIWDDIDELSDWEDPDDI